MERFVIVTDSYFDGVAHHVDGPYCILVGEGVIEDVVKEGPDFSREECPEACRQPGMKRVCAPFVMPGLVEAHCHVFLDGAQLDFQKRKDYLRAPFEEMAGVARRNLAKNIESGVTLLRDAGDIHGVNTRMMREVAADPRSALTMLSAGTALRKAKRYGSFMAREAEGAESIVRVIREIAPTASQLKILLTGIIDFEKGTMKGGPQFSLEETRLIVETAKELNLLTFAHCSGEDGLEIAVEAGIDCIEHGFFMSRRILEVMARKGIAWTPTYSPVDFQLQRPELAGWNSETCDRLRAILENHDKHVALAYEMGVPVVTGSDAGSYGAAHGQGLIDELFYLHSAGGSMGDVLASATSLPRRLWGCPSADITVGGEANLLLLAGSPFEDLENLRRPRAVFHRSWHYPGVEAVNPEG